MSDLQPKPTDAEIVASFLRVFCEPLGRAIVAEMQAKGLVVHVDIVAPAQQVQEFRANADQGKYESLERQYKTALAEIEKLRAVPFARHDENGPTEPKRTPEGKIILHVPGPSDWAKDERQDDPNDAAKAEVLDELIEHEDALTALPLKTRKCENCIRWIGGSCRSTRSPKANTSTGAANVCDWYFPREQGPAEPPAPAKIVKKNKTDWNPKPKGKCSHCGGTFPLVREGVLKAHDAEGKLYQLGHGDKSRPCAGSGKKP